MCGIAGYVGGREGSVGLVLDNLKRLEYRGYDSAGVAVVSPGGGGVRIQKKEGKLANLVASLNGLGSACGTVIAHTRWATHGRPSDTNAHPHCDCTGRIALIHNGIIENYLDIKERLLAEGHAFESDTDTEVLAHLIEAHYQAKGGGDLELAVRGALAEVAGAYAICVISEQEPETIYAAKTASPLIIGLGEGENFLASDIPAVMPHTRRVVVLEDGDFAVIRPEGVQITDLARRPLTRSVFEVNWDVQTAEKGGYPHFMLKEIHEQPQTIRDTLRGRITEESQVVFPELRLPIKKLLDFNRIVIVACGTAYHAGMMGKGFYEHLLRRPVEVQVASEFRYGDPIVDAHTLAIIISQSGETADTLAALREAKAKGATTLAIVNVVGSSIAREADEVLYTYAGPEICVASTKAYITQLVALYLIGLFIAQKENKLSADVVAAYIADLADVPQKMEELLARTQPVQDLAARLAHSSSCFFYLGRGFDFAIALEAALKMKEISYIHAEAYPAGEMKHGPLALVEPGVTVICLATQSALYDKMLSNVKEVKARDGIAVAVVKDGDAGLDERSVDAVLSIPATQHDVLMPLLAIVPLQLLAYYIASALGREIDQPRNLAKSVTVEISSPIGYTDKATCVTASVEYRRKFDRIPQVQARSHLRPQEFLMALLELDRETAARHEAEIHDEASKDDSVVPERYDITSFGADYDVDGLVRRLRRDDIIIPGFQRDYVWNQQEASRFVESLLLGLPVPGVFLAREADSNKLLVIDGQQRLKTLLFFFDGVFNPKQEEKTHRAFKLVKVQKKFEGLSYETLSSQDKLRLRDSIIHATIVKQDSPQDDDTSVYHIFERLNNGGRKLAPQQIRSAIYHGEFIALIKELNEYPKWRIIFGKRNASLKDQELILRFLALNSNVQDYKRPMKEFLNVYAQNHRRPGSAFLAEAGKLFRHVIDALWESVGHDAFRPERAVNAAVFDSVMVGVARAIGSMREPDPKKLKDAYETLLADKEYLRSVSQSTSDESSVKFRINRAIERFSGV